jgi:tetratricopeptide (TPR) repeat protein
MIRNKKFLFILFIVVLFGIFFYFSKNIKRETSSIFFNQGEKYFGKDNYNLVRAEKYYKTAIFIDSKYPVVHYQLGRIYFLNGNFNQAIAEFDEELSDNPTFRQSYYMRGLTYGYMQDYEKSISDFKKYIELAPYEWAPYNDLAWVYLIKNDYQNAENIVLEGLKTDHRNSWLLSNLGIARLNLGKYELAKENFLLAKQYSEKLSASDWDKTYPGNDPKIAESGIHEMKAAIFLNLATVDKKLNQKNEAKEYYQKYLDLLPENDTRRMSVDYFMAMP